MNDGFSPPTNTAAAASHGRLTWDGAVHAAAAGQQVVCDARRVGQGEEISQLIGGEAGVLGSFAQVHHRPREALLGHLPLEDTLLDGAYKNITRTHAHTQINTQFSLMVSN